MLVEDDPEHREAVCFVFESRGHEVRALESGAQALSALHAGQLPDVILLDLMMPAMDGWEFRLVQKRNALWASIPLIAISGLHTSQAAAIDADAFLHKSLGSERLCEAVDRVVAARARKQERARAGELERLVSLGALLGGISHEVNNPLAIAVGNLDIAHATLSAHTRALGDGQCEPVTRALRALDNVRLGVQRVTAVMRTATVFAAADLDLIEDIDVRALLESSMQIVANEVRHAARMVRELAGAPRVRGNAARLGQVFLNLLLNALGAIRDSGQKEHSLGVALQQSDGFVVVSVSETATPRAESLLGLLADPLAAAVRHGGRLRFDLAVSHELVEAMGGRIEVERLEPRGLAHRVWLPTQQDASLRADAAGACEDTDLAQKVLVIDDEPLICEMLKVMLSDHYEVTACTSARAGLSALRELDYSAILCDMMMPELSGDELFENAVSERPELRERFVFITGGAFAPRAQAFLRQPGRRVLHKPCSRRDLLAAIAHAVQKT